MNSYNNRYNSRSRFNSQILNRHFENINILAKIIEGSQQLIESNQSSYYRNQINMTSENRTYPESSNFILQFESLFPNSSLNQNRDINDNSYNIFNINSNNIEMLDVSNTNIDLFDIQSFSLIPNPINESCSITQETFDMSENVCMIKKCKHIFNKTALQRWIRTNNTCPTCRIEIRENSLESSSESQQNQRTASIRINSSNN